MSVGERRSEDVPFTFRKIPATLVLNDIGVTALYGFVGRFVRAG